MILRVLTVAVVVLAAGATAAFAGAAQPGQPPRPPGQQTPQGVLPGELTPAQKKALEARKALEEKQKKAAEERLRIQALQRQKAEQAKLKAEQAKAAAKAAREKQAAEARARAEARRKQLQAEAQRIEAERKAKAAAAKARQEAAAVAAAKKRQEAIAAREAAQKLKAEQLKAKAEAQRLKAEQAKKAAAEKLRAKNVQTTAPLPPRRGTLPPDLQRAREALIRERAAADNEYKREREAIERAKERDKVRFDAAAAKRFEQIRKARQTRTVARGVGVIEEPDKRVIVRRNDRAFVRHVERRRIERTARELRRERRRDGTTLIVNIGFDGVEIYTIEDDYGRIWRRYRRFPDGREVVIIDNRRFYERRRRENFIDAFVSIAVPVLAAATIRYVDYEDSSEDYLYDTLVAPPLEPLPRTYALEEVRQSYGLREHMRRVDLDTINFAFASWEVDPDQYPRLERMARVMKRILDRNPDEVFMIEGHTDAVGSDIDNLSLSDRRAETVAVILSETFRVPPENLVTQGYGEEYLKVETDGPSRANRRVSVRRITPLLSRDER